MLRGAASARPAYQTEAQLRDTRPSDREALIPDQALGDRPPEVATHITSLGADQDVKRIKPLA